MPKEEEENNSPWKSPEALEAAAGERPGSPALWDSWSAMPDHTDEMTQAIVAWLSARPAHGVREAREDAATRFDKAAKAANDLAFEIAAEFTRWRDEGIFHVYSPGKPLPAQLEIGEKERSRLRKALTLCGRWLRMNEIFPENTFWFRSLSPADLFLSDDGTGFESLGEDHERIGRLALDLRRIADLYRHLAKQVEKPTGRLDVERIKLIRFARKKGLSIGALARTIAGLGIGATRDPHPGPDAEVDSKRWIDEQAAIWAQRLESAEKADRKRRR